MKTLTQVLILLVLGCALAAGTGCDQGKLDEAQQAHIERVLRTGVEMPGDPFVRAETLRVMEILADSEFDDDARARTEDASPMVRVAALRVLMKTDADDARRLVMAAFNRAKVDEKRALLEAVFDHGSRPLQRELTARALRSDDERLRLTAFERGPVSRVEEALEAGSLDQLQNTLLPEVGRFITQRDDLLAARALRLAARAGQEERAQPLISQLQDPSTPADKRRQAASILARAGIDAAAPVFKTLLEDLQIDDEGSFVLPEQRDDALVRLATLGLAATGDPTYVPQAKTYLKNADVKSSIEVLEALSNNKAEGARVTLKIAMQDARAEVRLRAVQLYSARTDADENALIEVVRVADERARMDAARALARRYPEAWAAHIDDQLDRADKQLELLTLLRDVVDSDEELAVLVPLKARLLEFLDADDPRIASLAGISLVRIAKEPGVDAVLRGADDLTTRFAYLEHLVRTDPLAHVEFFQQNLWRDQFSLQLMSAAGLHAAFRSAAAPETPSEESEATGSEAPDPAPAP